MYRLKLVAKVAVVVGLTGAILFGAAGRIDLPFFWAYLAVFGGAAAFILLTAPRELIEKRFGPAGPSRDNLALLRVAALAAFGGQWVVAGLDARHLDGASVVPLSSRVAGLAGLVGVFAVWYWAMRVNPFFSPAVRIQRERGHRVVSSGPYRFVRHPGYAALVLLSWGSPLALGSWWAVIPHAALAVLFVHRAAIEDRMLRQELEGYAAYAAVVRYRLLPGVW